MQPSWWPSGVPYPLPPQGDPSWGKGPMALAKYAIQKKKVDDAKRQFDMLQGAVNTFRTATASPRDTLKPSEAAEALAPVTLPGPSQPVSSVPPISSPMRPLPSQDQSWSPPAQPFIPSLPVAAQAPAQMPTLFIQGDEAADSLTEGASGIGGGSAVSPWLIGAGALALVLFLGRK